MLATALRWHLWIKGQGIDKNTGTQVQTHVGCIKDPFKDNSLVGHRCLLVEHENLRLSHFTFNLLKTSGSRITKPIANKFVLYLKLAGWSKNICATRPLEGTWHLEVKLACYKDPLKKQWKLGVGAKCHCCRMAAAARTRQVEQCWKY